MVKTSGYTTPSSYNALGEPIKSSFCSDRPFDMAKLHQNGIMSQITTVTARNWKKKLSHWTQGAQIHLRCILIHPMDLCMIMYNI